MHEKNDDDGDELTAGILNFNVKNIPSIVISPIAIIFIAQSYPYYYILTPVIRFLLLK